MLMRRLYVYYLYIYLQHNTSCTQHRGKLRPRRFAGLALLCSDVTISRNQISSLSVLNKYIFTCLLMAPQTRSDTAPLPIDRAARVLQDMCTPAVSVCGHPTSHALKSETAIGTLLSFEKRKPLNKPVLSFIDLYHRKRSKKQAIVPSR